jgi:hypothetical protein
MSRVVLSIRTTDCSASRQTTKEKGNLLLYTISVSKATISTVRERDRCGCGFHWIGDARCCDPNLLLRRDIGRRGVMHPVWRFDVTSERTQIRAHRPSYGMILAQNSIDRSPDGRSFTCAHYPVLGYLDIGTDNYGKTITTTDQHVGFARRYPGDHPVVDGCNLRIRKYRSFVSNESYRYADQNEISRLRASRRSGLPRCVSRCGGRSLACATSRQALPRTVSFQI